MLVDSCSALDVGRRGCVVLGPRLITSLAAFVSLTIGFAESTSLSKILGQRFTSVKELIKDDATIRT